MYWCWTTWWAQQKVTSLTRGCNTTTQQKSPMEVVEWIPRPYLDTPWLLPLCFSSSTSMLGGSHQAKDWPVAGNGCKRWRHCYTPSWSEHVSCPFFCSFNSILFQELAFCSASVSYTITLEIHYITSSWLFLITCKQFLTTLKFWKFRKYILVPLIMLRQFENILSSPLFR